MIIGPIVELELPKHNDVLPEEYFNEENCFFFSNYFYLKYLFSLKEILGCEHHSCPLPDRSPS